MEEVETPPRGVLTIDEALEIAIQEGRMTIKEVEECREAYYRVFHEREGETS